MLYELLKVDEDTYVFVNNNVNYAFGDTIMSLHTMCYSCVRRGLKGKISIAASEKLLLAIQELLPFYALPLQLVPYDEKIKDKKTAVVARWTCYDLYKTPYSYFKPEYKWKPSASMCICHKIETEVKPHRVLPFDSNWFFQMEKCGGSLFELPKNLPLCVEKLKTCAAFVGGDSGPTHLARSVGCPIVLLHSPQWDWEAGFPYGSCQVKPASNPRELEVALRHLMEA